MTLTDATRADIRGRLEASKTAAYGAAWKDSDISKLTDNELTAFNNYLNVAKPMYEGISNPDGSRQVFNQQNNAWVYVPAPTGNATQQTTQTSTVTGGATTQPTTNGIPKGMQAMLEHATPEEREIWASAVQVHNDAKGVAIAQLVGNIAEPQRSSLIQTFNGMKLEQLRAMVSLIPQPGVRQAPSGPGDAPVGNNFFGGLGVAPQTAAGNVGQIVSNTGIQPLVAPTVNWAERLQQSQRPTNGTRAG